MLKSSLCNGAYCCPVSDIFRTFIGAFRVGDRIGRFVPPQKKNPGMIINFNDSYIVNEEQAESATDGYATDA